MALVLWCWALLVAIVVSALIIITELLINNSTLREIKEELEKLNSAPIDWGVLATQLEKHRSEILKTLRKPTENRRRRFPWHQPEWKCRVCANMNADWRTHCRYCGVEEEE